MLRLKNLLFSDSIWNRLLLGFLVFIQIFKGIYPACTEIRSDFPNYYVSSKLLLDGGNLSNLYNNDWFNDRISSYGIMEKGKFAPFPPPTAFVMLPMAVFEPISAKRIWTIINILLLIPLVRLFSKVSGLTNRQSLLFILMSGIALVNNFYLGQIYLLILLFMFVAFVEVGKNKLAGLCLAAGIALKYFPVVILPSMFVAKRFKAIAFTAIGLIALALLSIIIIGMKPCNDFINQVLFSHLNGKLEGQSPYASAFQSWNSFWMNVFVKDDVLNPHPVFDHSNLFAVAKMITDISLLGILLYTIYRLKSSPHFSEITVVLFSLFAFALSPASASYHFLLLLLSLAILLRLFQKDERMIAWIALFVVSVGFSGFVMDQLNQHVQFLPLRFYRLWLINGFFIFSCTALMRKFRF